jgi:hypothetical protein
MIYFAYGSNLDEDQMRTRCPGASRGRFAVLRGYALAFTGRSRTWGGAVATVVRAPDHSVRGLLWSLSIEDLALLDGFEGHPRVYQRVERVVIADDGARRRVHLYLVPKTRLSLGAPSTEYLELIRRAYRRHRFDEAALVRATKLPTL